MSDARHLAQINVGCMVARQGDPRVQGFFDALDEVNALADRSPGFGPTSHAFTFKLRFPPPGVGAPPVDMQPGPWCVGNA